MGVVCTHDNVLMVQLPDSGIQGSHEWDLWRDQGLGFKSLLRLGWLVDSFIQKDSHLGSSPGMGRTGLTKHIAGPEMECFVFPNSVVHSVICRGFRCTQIKITGKFHVIQLMHLHSIIWTSHISHDFYYHCNDTFPTLPASPPSYSPQSNSVRNNSFALNPFEGSLPVP